MAANETTGPDVRRAGLKAKLGPALEFDKELAPFTGYKTGGRAECYVLARSADDVVQAVTAAKELAVPFFLLGGGSNVLVSDHGYDGLIVKIDCRGMKVINELEITCGAGEQLMDLVNFAVENSLAGMEFASGIHGTVGGAIYGNAGAYGGDVGSLVSSLTLVTRSGEMSDVDAEYCRFGYRDSYLKTTGDVVINSVLALKRGDRPALKERVAEILQTRNAKFPPDARSAGCFFKNVPDPDSEHGKLPAGKLLEEVGAKGMTVGGAGVLPTHANILVNTGSATSKDISQLADLLKEKVLERFGIELQEEVVRIGEF